MSDIGLAILVQTPVINERADRPQTSVADERAVAT